MTLSMWLHKIKEIIREDDTSNNKSTWQNYRASECQLLNVPQL